MTGEPLTSNPLCAMARSLREAVRTYSPPPSDEAIAKCLDAGSAEIDRLTARVAELEARLQRMYADHPEKSCYDVPVFKERDRLRAALELIGKSHGSMSASEMRLHAQQALRPTDETTASLCIHQALPKRCSHRGCKNYAPDKAPRGKK